MSYPSALLGQPPISETDSLIRRGLLIIAGSQINPNKSQPFGPPRPANYHFETNAPSLVAGEGVAIFFIVLFTCARIFMRVKKKIFGLDDWLILPGAIGAAVYLSLDIVSHIKGCLGKHIYDCTYTEIYWFQRIADVEQPLFYFNVFCIKLSVAFANRRITGLASRNWTITHWVFITLFLVLLPLTVSLQAFQCLPVDVRYSLIAIGKLTDPKQIKCLDASAVSLSTRVLHIVTDLALLCVPIVILARLRMPFWNKMRIISLFALGAISTLASILRNIAIFRYNDDVPWQYYEVYVWNTVDITFAVIVASLPALNSLIDVGFYKLHSLVSRYNSRTSAERSKTSMDRQPPAARGAGMNSDVALHSIPSHGILVSSVFTARSESMHSQKSKDDQAPENYLVHYPSFGDIRPDTAR